MNMVHKGSDMSSEQMYQLIDHYKILIIRLQ